MRRRAARIALTLLLAALLALLATSGPAIWVALAYGPVERELGVDLRPKRWSWLPGPGAWIPAQSCPACQAGMHGLCCHESGGITLYGVDRLDSPGFVGNPTRIQGPTIVLGSSAGTTIRRTLVTDPRGRTIVVDLSRQTQVPNVEVSWLVLHGVEITPETFHCPCCERE